MRDGRRRMRARDLVGQAMFEALGRPARALLTVLGTVLGVGMFVATIAVTNTAQSQINQHFDVLVSTEVAVQDAHPDDRVLPLTPGAERRAMGLTGVTGAGLVGEIQNAPEISRLARSVGAPTSDQPALMYADVGALRILRPRLAAGREFDRRQLLHSAHVALLGTGAARALGLSTQMLPAAVYVGGARYIVEGFVRDTQRHREVLAAVVIPSTTAITEFGPDVAAAASLVVSTRLGYATAVGGVLAATVSPVDPDRVAVLTPPDPAGLRGEVTSDLSALLIVLAVVGLLVGIVGIGNTTLVSVLERVQEIGLRRALGARRGQIAAQFLLESLALGTVGGMLGACLGTTGATAVAVAKGWSPVLPVWLPVCAPLLGTLAGLVAGCYPAMRAARIDPVRALTR